MKTLSELTWNLMPAKNQVCKLENVLDTKVMHVNSAERKLVAEALFWISLATPHRLKSWEPKTFFGTFLSKLFRPHGLEQR